VNAVHIKGFAQVNYQKAVRSAHLPQCYLDKFVTHVEKSYNLTAIVEECAIPLDLYTTHVRPRVDIRYSDWTKEQ